MLCLHSLLLCWCEVSDSLFCDLGALPSLVVLNVSHCAHLTVASARHWNRFCRYVNKKKRKVCF